MTRIQTSKTLVGRLEHVVAHANSRGKPEIAAKYGAMLESLQTYCKENGVKPEKLRDAQLREALVHNQNYPLVLTEDERRTVEYFNAKFARGEEISIPIITGDIPMFRPVETCKLIDACLASPPKLDPCESIDKTRAMNRMKELDALRANKTGLSEMQNEINEALHAGYALIVKSFESDLVPRVLQEAVYGLEKDPSKETLETLKGKIKHAPASREAALKAREAIFKQFEKSDIQVHEL